jgi:hypothetical protein
MNENQTGDEPHKIIWLQVDPTFSDSATWCQDQIGDGDVKYILASEVEKLEEENAELQKLLSNSLGVNAAKSRERLQQKEGEPPPPPKPPPVRVHREGVTVTYRPKTKWNKYD